MKPRVKITPVDPPGTAVTAQLADGVSRPSADGGWTIIHRPKRKAATVWEAQQPYTLELPILFDGFARDQSVEAEIEVLRRIMRVPLGRKFQPAVVKLDGPISMTRLRWVIQSMDPGEEIRRDSDGQRVRAAFTLSLIEYVPADILVQQKASPAKQAKERAEASGTASTKTHTVRAGDTLWKVAQAALGRGERWPEIAKLNGIRDPRALRIGQVLRIP